MTIQVFFAQHFLLVNTLLEPSYSDKIAMQKLIDEVERLHHVGWFEIASLIFTALNILAFVVLTYKVYKLTEAQGKAQVKLQNDNIKVQLYQRRLDAYNNILKFIHEIQYSFDRRGAEQFFSRILKNANISKLEENHNCLISEKLDACNFRFSYSYRLFFDSDVSNELFEIENRLVTGDELLSRMISFIFSQPEPIIFKDKFLKYLFESEWSEAIFVDETSAIINDKKDTQTLNVNDKDDCNQVVEADEKIKYLMTLYNEYRMHFETLDYYIEEKSKLIQYMEKYIDLNELGVTE